jgi:hypothetical protein
MAAAAPAALCEPMLRPGVVVIEEAPMSRTYDYDLKTGTLTPTAENPHARRQALDRLEQVTRLLDTALVIPGTNIRFGADAVIGLVPGVGDAITTAISAWVIYEARRLGAPRRLIMRMIGNVALDGMVGAVPLAGDLFDMMFKANRRNMRLLREWMARQER